MIIVFSGSIGRFPIGGHAWTNMQYLIGLRELGHEVYYMEECGAESWVYNWETEQLTTDLDYPAGYIRTCLDPIGFSHRWIYGAGEYSRGMDVAQFREVCAAADLLLVRAVPLALWRDEYSWPRRRAFIDVDPGFNQIGIVKGEPPMLRETVDRCESLFTIGQRIGASDCESPSTGRPWHKTLSPVALSQWSTSTTTASDFTCVIQWRGFHDVVHNNISYGQKDKEFSRFLSLPASTRQTLRIALTGAAPENLQSHGWKVEPGWIVSRTPSSYREFIQTSRAEFSIAKQGYVRMRCGWFSDRSACYLASGRPALVEDTGISDWLPSGAGLLTFRDPPEALAGIDSINSDYDSHARAARTIAERYFSTERVLPPLLEAATG
jgi:hypothetical protein